jgi:hypothetical protein
LVFCLLIVAGGGGALLRVGIGWDSDANWTNMAAALAVALSAVTAMYWLTNWLWSIAAGLLLMAHPLFWLWAKQGDVPLWSEALSVLSLAGTVVGWRLAVAATVPWLGWIVTAVLLIAAQAVAWPVQPRVGLLAALVVVVGFGLAAAVGTRLRSRQKSISLANMVVAALLAVLIPGAGLFLARVSIEIEHLPRHRLLADKNEIEEFVSAAFQHNPYFGFASADLDRWAWPLSWVVVPVMLYGWWRSLRRGFKSWAAAQPPLAWTLSLYALIEAVTLVVNSANAQEMHFLPLATLAVLLSVYAVADLFLGLSERLVLTPPGHAHE